MTYYITYLKFLNMIRKIYRISRSNVKRYSSCKYENFFNFIKHDKISDTTKTSLEEAM